MSLEARLISLLFQMWTHILLRLLPLRFLFLSFAHYPHLTMLCTGSTGKGDECGCESFIPKASKPHRCKSCGHRHTSHTATVTSPQEPEETELIPAKNHGPNYAERVYKASKATGILKKARKETLQGYRPSLPPAPVRLLAPPL